MWKMVAQVINYVPKPGLAKYTDLLSSDSNKAVISPLLLAKSSVQNIQVAASHSSRSFHRLKQQTSPAVVHVSCQY